MDIAGSPGGRLTNYEVRIDLDASNVPAQFDWNGLGDDLRVIADDDLTELPFFIERWDAGSRSAILWVQVPSIRRRGTSVFIYFGATGTANQSTILTFTQVGTKFHTRNSTADPADRASAEAAFASASPQVGGYGCTYVPSYTALENSTTFSPPPRDVDFGLFGEAWFQVLPGEAGAWQFRYGPDFGYGGGLYIDDQPLEEDWNDDLWWANDFANTGETLSGTVNLAAGWHSMRVLGFEGCCDGDQTLEFSRPAGGFQAFSTANLPIVTRQCPIRREPQPSTGPVEIAPCPTITVSRNTQVDSDPVNLAVNPKAIPGAVIVNEVRVSNSGSGPADAGTMTITDAIPADVALRVIDYDGSTVGPVRFVDGTPASGLSYAFVALNSGADDVEFSDDNGLTFTYSPVADANGVDRNVTHIRILPGGQFQPDTGLGSPAASFRFKTIVQ